MRLALWLGAFVCLAVVAHLLSPMLPGAAGEIFRRNAECDIEATALIYTESGDVRDYLDADFGRYR